MPIEHIGVDAGPEGIRLVRVEAGFGTAVFRVYETHALVAVPEHEHDEPEEEEEAPEPGDEELEASEESEDEEEAPEPEGPAPWTRLEESIQATLAELASPAGSWDVVLGMSILHLVPDRAATLARVHELLKPGAVFISSTICIGDASWLMRVLAPVFRALPLLPSISSLTLKQLQDELKCAGFEIEDCWRPDENKAAFVVARKRLSEE